MRRTLDALYLAAGRLAGVFMVGTLAFVLIGITGRLANFHLRGTDAAAVEYRRALKRMGVDWAGPVDV